jgi:hypothetical protein
MARNVLPTRATGNGPLDAAAENRVSAGHVSAAKVKGCPR